MLLSLCFDVGWFFCSHFLLLVYSLFCVVCSVLVRLWQGFVPQRCVKAIGIPSCQPTHIVACSRSLTLMSVRSRISSVLYAPLTLWANALSYE